MMIDEHEDEAVTHFREYVAQGGKVEATTWMPDEYRQSLICLSPPGAGSEQDTS
ncbi:hypothetical protein [Dictyobacter arantiisoli]|uniref:Uncharacterized protein n=1 Tax=Dictyobacter arantiisoli TaxID=2014874 RepID=A0A5A5TGA3_9CHLR|nr:hypothetical protein [Dictyobacter arantiisoli]GCF10255.1 hypothetical protein KDI_38190 [Dictyobacter arantiisoli]